LYTHTVAVGSTHDGLTALKGSTHPTTTHWEGETIGQTDGVRWFVVYTFPAVVVGSVEFKVVGGNHQY